jgi:hypothetical protein
LGAGFEWVCSVAFGILLSKSVPKSRAPPAIPASIFPPHRWLCFGSFLGAIGDSKVVLETQPVVSVMNPQYHIIAVDNPSL